jgi:hypothetical protein
MRRNRMIMEWEKFEIQTNDSVSCTVQFCFNKIENGEILCPTETIIDGKTLISFEWKKSVLSNLGDRWSITSGRTLEGKLTNVTLVSFKDDQPIYCYDSSNPDIEYGLMDQVVPNISLTWKTSNGKWRRLFYFNEELDVDSSYLERNDEDWITDYKQGAYGSVCINVP